MKTLKSEKNRILKTKDYTIFNINKDDKIHKLHLDKIAYAIQEKNLLKDFPILVDDSYNILDGKYRFQACKNLGFEVYYKIAEVSTYLDALKARSLNNKPTLIDFSKHHSDKLFYRKLLEVNKILPYSFNSVLLNMFDVYFVRKDKRIKSYNEFMNGSLEYTQEMNFKINSTLEFIDYLYSEYNILEKNLRDIVEHLDAYSFNMHDAKEGYGNIKFLNIIIEIYNSGNPYALSPLCFDFDFVYEKYPKPINFNDNNIEDWIKYAEWDWENCYNNKEIYEYLTALRLLR